jgi:hypothetical protein
MDFLSQLANFRCSKENMQMHELMRPDYKYLIFFKKYKLNNSILTLKFII